MTTVAPVTTNPAASAAAATTATDQTQLAGNFNTFLTLLTTQLQNQDPLVADGFQPVHAAAGRVQPGRAADQHQHQSADADLARARAAPAPAPSAISARTSRSPTATRALTNGAADWNYTLAGAVRGDHADRHQCERHTSSTTRPGATDAGSNTTSPGTAGQQRQPAARRHLHAARSTRTAADGLHVTTTVSSTGVVSEINMTGAHAATDDRTDGRAAVERVARSAAR